MVLRTDSYTLIIEIYSEMQEFLAEIHIFLTSLAPIPSPFFATTTYFNLSPTLPLPSLPSPWKRKVATMLSTSSFLYLILWKDLPDFEEID